jgi:hypothetical protein
VNHTDNVIGSRQIDFLTDFMRFVHVDSCFVECVFINANFSDCTTPDSEMPPAVDTDPISQGLAALQKRLEIELKVF